MTEPGVTLTDYAVALECAVFVVLLGPGRGRSRGLRFWFMLFFASMSAASICGGTVHGFFLDEQTRGYAILWPTALLVAGVTTFATWAIGARLLFSTRAVRWAVFAAGVQLALYWGAVLLLTQAFWVAIADSLPAILFLLLALVLAYRREKQSVLLLAAGGPALNLVAALLQQLGVGIHPVYFNHNVLYHVLQAVALFLFFQGGRWLVECRPARVGER